MPLPDTLPPQVASSKYAVFYDEAGLVKVLELPTGRAILSFNGTDAYWADGSVENPLYLTGQETIGPSNFVFAEDLNGKVIKFGVDNNDGFEYMMVSLNGVISWVKQKGLPAGNGFLSRMAAVNSPALWLSAKGIPYNNTAGDGTIISNGANGQEFRMKDNVPQWVDKSGSTVSGGFSAGLLGTTARNTNSNNVNMVGQSFSLTRADGDQVTVLDFDVNASLAASNGPGGLDIGVESASNWYYYYLISDGAGLVDACLSLDPIAPNLTNLGVYVYQSLVGVFRNDTGSSIVAFLQQGNHFFTRGQTLSTGEGIGTSLAEVPTTVDLDTIVPPNVRTVGGYFGNEHDTLTDGEFVGYLLAADANGMGKQHFNMARSLSVAGFNGIQGATAVFQNMPILDSLTPKLYWQAKVAAASMRFIISSYTI